MMFPKLLSFLYSRHRVFFFEVNIVGAYWMGNSDSGIVCRKYMPKDAGNLQLLLNNMEFAPDFSLSDVNDRICEGQLFYLALLHGEIIGYCWWSFGDIYLPYCHTTIKLNENESFCYNNYIHIDHRGASVLNSIRFHAYKDMVEKGITSDWLCCYSWNISARRAAQKVGYHIRGSVCHGYFCGFKYVYSNDKIRKLVTNNNPLELWIILYKSIIKFMS